MRFAFFYFLFFHICAFCFAEESISRSHSDGGVELGSGKDTPGGNANMGSTTLDAIDNDEQMPTAGRANSSGGRYENVQTGIEEDEDETDTDLELQHRTGQVVDATET